VKQYKTKLDSTDVDVARHIAHGHLAFQLLWCAAASVLTRNKGGKRLVEQLESGNRQEKLTISADLWAQESLVEGKGSLSKRFLSWLSLGE
jgi:hypothetical protein